MRTFFIILMFLLAFAIAAVAIANSEIVTVSYLFGQIELNLFAVILGSAFGGIVVMLFFMIYRSIHNYVKSESERSLKKELQRQLKALETENKKLEEEIGKLQREREVAAEKARAELENEKKKLEDELTRQQRERESIMAKEQAELEAEKQKLEAELKKHQVVKETPETELTSEDPSAQKGFFDFLKK
jgi:uncharacterized integral membrane protein